MTFSRQGRLSPITGAYAADIETLPTTGGVQLNYYNESFNASEGFASDDVIIHNPASGRDQVAPAPSIRRASGGLTVPLDFNHLKFFLPMLLGSSTDTEDIGTTPSTWTRVFTSGKSDLQLAAFDLPVADDKFKLVQPSFLNSLALNLTKEDGFRNLQLGLLTPDVTLGAAAATFATASPTSIAAKPAPGSLGTFSIGGTVVASLIDGSFTYDNQAQLIDMADGKRSASALELGDTLIRGDLNMRVVAGTGVNDVLDNFKGPVADGGTPFAGEISFALDASTSLTIAMPYCVGERRAPVVGSAQRQTFSASFQAFQDSGAPAATITLVNQIA